MSCNIVNLYVQDLIRNIKSQNAVVYKRISQTVLTKENFSFCLSLRLYWKLFSVYFTEMILEISPIPSLTAHVVYYQM